MIKNPSRKTESSIQLPEYKEKTWLMKSNKVVQQSKKRRLTTVRLHFSDPTVTNLEKIKINELITFLEDENKQLKFYVSTTPNEESTKEEKEEIIKESHGTVASQLFGENKAIERA